MFRLVAFRAVGVYYRGLNNYLILFWVVPFNTPKPILIMSPLYYWPLQSTSFRLGGSSRAAPS